MATGVYGTLAYRVNNRTSEIGVRIAMGAQRRQVVWMVLRDSLMLTAVGVIIGIPLSLLLGKALTSALYGVQAYDAVSYVFAALGILAVAIAASVIPARRAAGVDPLTALRHRNNEGVFADCVKPYKAHGLQCLRLRTQPAGVCLIAEPNRKKLWWASPSFSAQVR